MHFHSFDNISKNVQKRPNKRLRYTYRYIKIKLRYVCDMNINGIQA